MHMERSVRYGDVRAPAASNDEETKLQRVEKSAFVKCVSNKADERNEHYNLIPKRAFTPKKIRLPIRVVRRCVESVDLSHKIRRTATIP